MSYFNFDNRKVYYKIKGRGTPLLLLHGNTVSSKMFSQIIRKYAKEFQVILLDFPGHGKSDRLTEFEIDFWFYNSKVAYALINELKLENTCVIGTSGGALVAINLALEHPEKVKYLIADSFEGEYPLPSYISSIENDRERDKKKILAKLIWYFCHGTDWKKIIDLDTKVNIEFSKTGKSFFHKSISDLNVPTLLTGSMEDEYCDYLDKIYGSLQEQNKDLKIHLFEKGSHPAIISNKEKFLYLIMAEIKNAL
ncbi:Pimeloyl-ACP methyl ester carboxylesterase [Saccharicrinis carchari]|uniref:Pimeloyl-ACP methyl ester carboxylesterase n=1 Tax=Saccharicrinis carchari TaxID=1168039 RepID=A0A521DJ14_SACCC|nr:alpha/beta hydrolase [Saccharicrinis carchari]SMO71636.1 Pimeloyl-ACP methyl ester carboxylesterase [Saccharicrinis carchari]